MHDLIVRNVRISQTQNDGYLVHQNAITIDRLTMSGITQIGGSALYVQPSGSTPVCRVSLSDSYTSANSMAELSGPSEWSFGPRVVANVGYQVFLVQYLAATMIIGGSGITNPNEKTVFAGGANPWPPSAPDRLALPATSASSQR
ncbi:hypothetical protein [Cryobacterium ruanii]|uniref:hypothetical protein n=1 Tax=Cryobacterium ruanii TaxID=1259197 RepID=UPI001A7EBC3F|nr:hypothetical protein [Cryobacterium ruanii]